MNKLLIEYVNITYIYLKYISKQVADFDRNNYNTAQKLIDDIV